MDMLELRLSDQVTLAVPGRLDSITTYVLLEQESWFEKALGFLSRWLKRGMTAIDIGANLGVYSLPMARLVGPEGRVFAYEPGSEARSLLARSRAINAAARQGAWNAHRPIISDTADQSSGRHIGMPSCC
jgi:hypothetical protein